MPHRPPNPSPVATTELRVTHEDLRAMPDAGRIVIRSEDLPPEAPPGSGQVWVAVDFSRLGWVPAQVAVPDHVDVGGVALRPFLPGVSAS